MCQKFVENLRKVGRSPRTAADAPVGLLSVFEEPDQGSGADGGVRHTTEH
jgi:hypothetical protein